MIWNSFPFLFTILAYSEGENQKHEHVCSKFGQKCIKTEDCCLGVCVEDNCNDSLYRNNRNINGTSTEESDLIIAELATGNNIDVSEHKNVHLIAPLNECGVPLNKSKQRPKRIVGGMPYELGKYPWAVSIHLNEISDGSIHFHCGGSLIGRKYILTAAHCATRINTGQMFKWVTLGNVDRRPKVNCTTDGFNEGCISPHFVDAEVEDWIVHESFSEAHVRHDIAIIRLKHEVNYTDYIRPICLPRSENIFKTLQDVKFIVTGWGNQNDPYDKGSSVESVLAQEVESYLVHRSICDRFYSRTIGNLRRSQICAGFYPGKSDCGGDSGGPLFKRIPVGNFDRDWDSLNERYFLFGLVSTGAVSKCAREGKPSVFTSTMYYMPWILDNLVEKNRKFISVSTARTSAKPVEEFATGYDPQVDITNHENIEMLPKFPNCGLPHSQQELTNATWNNNPIPHVRVKRIVGGIAQNVGYFPWMAQIYTKDIVTGESVFRCGGALISSRVVLTAAHCVIDIRGSYVLDIVILGNFNRKEKTECLGTFCMEQKVILIEDIVAHEGFTKYSREHDVALIKLAQDVTFNRLIQPICLPLREDLVSKAWPKANENKYTVAGWGRVTADSAEDTLSNILIGANFTLEKKSYCESVFVRRTGRLENSRVCGGGATAGRGECIGDTGGPMMRWITMKGPDGENYKRMFSFGILSVVECAHQGVPSLYQNLLYYMPWIMDNLNI